MLILADQIMDITITSFSVAANGVLTAEIRWDPSAPAMPAAPNRVNVPGGGWASIGVAVTNEIPRRFVTINITPDDVPEPDTFKLPISVTSPLPAFLLQSKIPSLLGNFYRIEGLSMTPFGMRITTATSPVAPFGAKIAIAP